MTTSLNPVVAIAMKSKAENESNKTAFEKSFTTWAFQALKRANQKSKEFRVLNTYGFISWLDESKLFVNSLGEKRTQNI